LVSSSNYETISITHRAILHCKLAITRHTIRRAASAPDGICPFYPAILYDLADCCEHFRSSENTTALFLRMKTRIGLCEVMSDYLVVSDAIEALYQLSHAPVYL
jgi:hypothetical protein